MAYGAGKKKNQGTQKLSIHLLTLHLLTLRNYRNQELRVKPLKARLCIVPSKVAKNWCTPFLLHNHVVCVSTALSATNYRQYTGSVA